MGIFDRLPFLRTTKDFDEGIPAIEAELGSARAQLAAAEAGREDAIFSGGDGAVAAVNAEIARARDAVSTLEVAVNGARRRRDEARAVEHREHVERQLERAPAIRDAIVDLLRGLHPHAKEIAAGVQQLRVLQNELQSMNQYAVAEGRKDLLAALPWGEWNETVRVARLEEFSARASAKGTVLGTPNSIPVNLQPGQSVQMPTVDGQATHLPGYLPAIESEHWLEAVFPELKSAKPARGIVTSIADRLRGARKSAAA